jgi:hypothetical protein
LMVSKFELEALAGFIPTCDRERMKGIAVVVDPATEVIVTILHMSGRSGARYRRQRSGRLRRTPLCEYARTRLEPFSLYR